jgi:hypothetical protein
VTQELDQGRLWLIPSCNLALHLIAFAHFKTCRMLEGIMALRDYAYMDSAKIDQLVEQIAPPVTYDKVATWEVGLKISGPSVKGTQERPGRPLTRAEKIDALLEHLEDEKILGRGRVSWFPYNKDIQYRLETCNTVPATIRAKGLRIWVSERNEKDEPHPLLLLENAATTDEGELDVGSAYGILVALADQGCDLRAAFGEAEVGPFGELRQKRRELSANSVAGEVNELYGSTSKVMGGFDQWRNRFEQVRRRREKAVLECEAEVREENLNRRFAADPARFFQWLGANMGARQRIETLYRVRVVMPDTVHKDVPDSRNKAGVLTIGYPLFICSAGPI